MNENVKEHGEKLSSQVRGYMPEIKVTDLVNIGLRVAAGKLTADEAVEELKNQYGPAVKESLKQFTQDRINDFAHHADMEDVLKLSDTEFAQDAYNTATLLIDAVKKYYSGEEKADQFLLNVVNNGVHSLGEDMLKACGIDVDELKEEGCNFVNFSSPAVAYLCLSSAYNILMKALEDAHIAYERRLQIEKECKETEEMIRSYRLEMQEVVSKYLKDHLQTFGSGLDAMNKALLENDTDGYIRGNVEIQKMLNYDVQFTNQEEFDDLMDSDIPLKM